ncbi:peptidylprolyl isomerase [Helicobacter monodelphidis]|uniref:peptidylprolyl isomerase n=1 Tax=Helicobacter sp. 15-1451 TaxID=2004995 RepID=UPI000DCDC4CF|nr:peptidylprolyl isomerase [Helicobacter sp. 15-1451]RAX56718.1 peptidylprolyl isomerase [Helicobacter sp. 15-1451]
MKKKLLQSAVAMTFLMSGFAFAKTYAIVDGQEITDKEIAMIMRVMPPGTDYTQLPPDVQKNILNQAIDQRLLVEKAKKEGIRESSDFKKALKDAEDELALGVWMKKELDKVKVDDSEIQKFYDTNKEKLFKQPEMIKARHILVNSEAEAKEIIAELGKAKGDILKRFESLSKEKSIDKGVADNGGDLGWFPHDRMTKDFSDAAFKLAKNNYSKTPVKTEFGYHIIYVDDKKKAGTIPLKEAKERITQGLKLQKFKDNVSQTATDLRKSAKIEIK